MRYIIACLALTLFLGGCKKGEVEVILNKRAFEELSLFTFQDRLVGIEPGSLEKGLDYRFNSLVTFGDLSGDRVYLAEQSRELGVWGNKVLVVNDRGRVEGRVETLPNPYLVKVVKGRLITDSAAFYEDGYTAFRISGAGSGAVLYEDREIPNWIVNTSSWLYKERLLLGIAPSSENSRPSYFLREIGDKPVFEQDFSFTGERPFEIFTCLVSGERLIIVYRDSLELVVFDLPSKRMIKRVELRGLGIVPEPLPEMGLWLLNPYEVAGKIVVLLKDISPELEVQKLLTFDSERLELEGALELDPRVAIEGYRLAALRSGKIFFQKMDRLAVFSLADGALLKEGSILEW